MKITTGKGSHPGAVPRCEHIMNIARNLLLSVVVAGGLGAGLPAPCPAAPAPANRGANHGRVPYLDFDKPESRRHFESVVQEIVRQGKGRIGPSEIEFVGVDGADSVALNKAIAALLQAGPPAIIATSGEIARAIRLQNSRVPIVFMSHADPVAIGIVDHLFSSGNNATGITFFLPLDLKRLELLHDVVPGATSIGILQDKWALEDMPTPAEMRAAERALGVRVQIYSVSTREELDRFKASGAVARHDAWYVPANYIAWLYPAEIVAYFNAHRRPVIYGERQYVARGGLMAIQPIPLDPPSQLARRVVAILSGASPSAIPIERPKGTATFFNVATADKLGIRIPKGILGRALEIFD